MRRAPTGYDCPFCTLVRGGDTTRSCQGDVVLRDDRTTAFVAPKWWLGSEGHVLVVPNTHHENLYDIPDAALGHVYSTVRRVAVALREAYGCDGTSTRQHNEPAGNQDVWHLHVHVFPRWDGHDLYANHEHVRWTDAAERRPYAERLRASLTAR